jgi:hypothetical protein
MTNIRLPLALILIAFLLALASMARAADSQNLSITPPPGSPERTLIMNALRAQILELHNIDAVFVVRHLKVKDGWAWAHTLPQSPDGKSHYEDVSALLRKHGPAWEVAELACTEEENDRCVSNPDYFKLLQKRFPELPPDILPHGEEARPDLSR